MPLIRMGMVCCWLALCASAAADLFVHKDPDDGAWARFHWNERWNDGEENVLQFTFKAVGTKTVDDRRCRWIEVNIQTPESVRRGVASSFKLLIPGQELKGDGDVIDSAVEVWRKPFDGDAARFDDLKDNPRLYLFFFPLLPGRMRERVMLTERQKVAWQEGTLDCSVVEGVVQEKFTYDRTLGRCRLAVHESVPFGFASARLEIDNADGEHGVISLSLIDFGTNAVSELPDVK
uniref:DUF3108 domain-containing protein n=1 Tax=Schlesneria paludicola TaxID=360056 RepID=A0A7C2NW53_9PLAN